MASTAFVFINTGYGVKGQVPPNAQVFADIIVKDEHDMVTLAASAGCSAILAASDTQETILAKLADSARQLTGDPELKVVFL